MAEVTLKEFDVRIPHFPEDVVLQFAKDRLGLVSRTDGIAGADQYMMFKTLGISDSAKRPDGWFLPDDKHETAFILETKASNVVLDARCVDRILGYIDEVSKVYGKVVGMLYNGYDIRLFVGHREIRGCHELHDLNYYLKLADKFWQYCDGGVSFISDDAAYVGEVTNNLFQHEQGIQIKKRDDDLLSAWRKEKGKQILLFSLKGGTGRTVLADEIMFSFERSKIPFSFYELTGKVDAAHQSRLNTEAKICIVDCPVGTTSDVMEYIDSADLIVVPVGMSGADIVPVMQVHKLLDQCQKHHVLYVLNRKGNHSLFDDFEKAYSKKYPNDRSVVLNESSDFYWTSLTMHSVLDPDSNSSLDTVFQMRKVVNTVREMIGCEPENFGLPIGQTSMTLSVSQDEKYCLHMMAADRNLSVHELIASWMQKEDTNADKVL